MSKKPMKQFLTPENMLMLWIAILLTLDTNLLEDKQDDNPLWHIKNRTVETAFQLMHVAEIAIIDTI